MTLTIVKILMFAKITEGIKRSRTRLRGPRGTSMNCSNASRRSKKNAPSAVFPGRVEERSVPRPAFLDVPAPTEAAEDAAASPPGGAEVANEEAGEFSIAPIAVTGDDFRQD